MMIIILGILGVILYAVVTWIVGRSLRKQIALKRYLMKQKRELPDGYSLSEKWYDLKKKSTILIPVFLLILVCAVAVVIWVCYMREIRISYILLYCLFALSPALCGYAGIIPIPIPGIEIED